MKPKEKAEELYARYDTIIRDNTRGVSVSELAKESALIAVDEIIQSDTQFYYGNYWQEVKQEIEKL
jgi:hypothetical protein